MYILLRIDYDRHISFHFGRAVLSTHIVLSSDIRSEGSIAIVKKFDFDFFMISGSTSLP